MSNCRRRSRGIPLGSGQWAVPCGWVEPTRSAQPPAKRSSAGWYVGLAAIAVTRGWVGRRRLEDGTRRVVGRPWHEAQILARELVRGEIAELIVTEPI